MCMHVALRNLLRHHLLSPLQTHRRLRAWIAMEEKICWGDYVLNASHHGHRPNDAAAGRGIHGSWFIITTVTKYF